MTIVEECRTYKYHETEKSYSSQTHKHLHESTGSILATTGVETIGFIDIAVDAGRRLLFMICLLSKAL